ncbi:MAG: FkbM family methyltransferase [Elusimicrobiota bacterium]|jgi:FkbM family methyltransferase|nr:FkbM family methyltransferase [Elusimicrobiota bacterium]
MKKLVKILKNRMLVIKKLGLFFVQLLLNKNIISLKLFNDYFICFIFGTRFSEKYIFKDSVILRHYDKGYYYDFEIFKILKIDNKSLFTDLFFENIIFFIIDKGKNVFNKDHLYENFGLKIEKNDIVVDAGANIGAISAYAAYKGANVYAFEPIPETIEYLEKTIELNKNLPGTIKIEPFALSNKTEKIKFLMNSNYLVNSSAIKQIQENRDYAQKEIEVNAITLDEWVKKNNIEKIDFIKADIEGAERYMLLGATKVLKNMKPKLAICTYHLPDDKQVLEKIVKDANPTYQIFHGKMIMYAR